MSKDHCQSCPAEVRWAETLTGARMLVDAEPVENGNIILSERIGDVPLAMYVPPIEQPTLIPGPPRYVSHFATCPDAEKWRKT